MKRAPIHHGYSAVIASALIGVIALCIDRSSAAAPAPAPPRSASFLSASLKTMMSEDGLDPESGLNPFAPSRRWAPPVQAAPVAPAKSLPRGDDFKKTHVLSALMQSASGGMAIVNGRLLKIGDVVDGYKLMSISPTSATLANQSAPVELQMVGASDNVELAPPR